MKKIFIPSLLVMGLCACSNGESSSEQSSETLAVKQTQQNSGVILANMDTSVNPGDDFNQFVNGKWMSTATIADDKTSAGVWVQLRDASQDNVKKIIEESSTGTFAKGSNEQKVGDLYNSYLDMEKRNALGVTPLDFEFSAISGISDYSELAVYFAEANKRGYNPPFALGQYVDLKNPSTYMIYTWQAGLGLPDKEYYFKDDEKSLSIRAKYRSHIEKMFKLAGLNEGKKSADTILAIETALAGYHLEKEKTRDMVALYNKIPLSELTSIMADFDWHRFLTTAGVNDIDGLVITQLDYMKNLNNVIKNTPLDSWKVYLKWQALSANGARLTAAIDQENFDFKTKTLWGAKEQQPMWRRGVGVVNATLGEVIGKVYVKRHFPPAAKARMLTMVNNLFKAYEQSIKQLDWMTAETKLQALDKLSKFTPKIGYPDTWKDYSKLEINADDYFGNIERAALVVYQQNLDRQKGPVDKTEWGMNPQTINAYYNPPLNEIVFPAGILQPPFFDMNAEDAVNYGAIGAVIGHEIGHGFDDAGSTFDGDGVLRNWWTDKDKAEFKNRTNALVAQYDAFKVFPDLNVNGTFTLGENIGDLGGLSIGMKAYKLSLQGKEAPVLDGFTGEQRVLIGFGQVWRGVFREEMLRQLVGTNPHSPAKFRVNGTVRNVPEFYSAFDVATDGKLYLAPEQRVKIW
ncbi:M13 family metallopeptidase [Thalassotalea sp. ND16A]|uniref:M13 family metallopeptidase n=1 Tax=Thalassotalea sp. ND16A TaxID=1535422 RepID=UPI00051A5FB8|nr:M13-type metalloendopeptidase [Thalassotalea sp. ND16A]KGJ92464.1 Endothelin-converting enzyme 1 [Thalassotalea sp. ND16A]